jgi:hypothetical protein
MSFNEIEGTLQVSNGAVTGTVTPFVSYTASNPNLCAAVNTSLTAAGTLDTAHDLTLTFPIAGGTGTLLATLPDNPQTYANGSWQIAGGTCAMSVTPMIIKGSTTFTTTSPAPITASLSGNWAIGATPNMAVNSGIQPVLGFSGSLQFANGSVTGILSAAVYPTETGCQQAIAGTAAATGTLDANNNLTLTAPIAGGTATITATLGSNPQTLADGSYQIVGGSCAISANTMTIAQYAPLTGTYTGTFNVSGTGNVPVAGSNVTVTAVLTQSATANGIGYFPITGTVKVTGACTDSLTYTGFAAGGNFYSLTGPFFMGSFGPTASAIYDAVYQSTNCPAYYQGTLTRQ